MLVVILFLCIVVIGMTNISCSQMIFVRSFVGPMLKSSHMSFSIYNGRASMDVLDVCVASCFTFPQHDTHNANVILIVVIVVLF